METGKTPDEINTITLLEQCEAVIVRLESQLEHQRRLRENLKKNLILLQRKRQNPVIDRVPTEIFTEIFEILTNQDPLSIGAILMVCQGWNRIACSSPGLWSFISINFVPDPKLIKHNIGYLAVAIRNSASMPLKVELNFPGGKDLFDVVSTKLLWTKEPSSELVGTLDQHRLQAEWLYQKLDDDFSENEKPFRPYIDVVEAIDEFLVALYGTGEIIGRIRSLSMSWSDYYFQEVLEKKIHYPVPMLEELSIRSGGWMVDDPFTYLAPNLTRLSLDLELYFDILLPQGNQLTELDLWACTPAIFPVVHQHAKSLKYLCLGFKLSPHILYLDRFILPQLEELTLRTPFPGDSGPDSIQAPRLKILRILHKHSLDCVLDTAPCFLTLRVLELWTPTPLTDYHIQALDACIARLEFLEEISFIHDSDISCIRKCMRSVKKGTVSIKGYIARKRGELERSRWSYEEKDGIEIYLDS